MNKILLSLVFVLFTVSGFSCMPEQSNRQDQKEMTKADTVEVYYFHYTRRCITCNSVESNTKAAINEFFADAVSKGKLSFKSINIDEKSNKNIAKQLKVSGQTLLFVANNEQVNLTNFAFMNAKSNPEKVKQAVKDTIEDLLIQ
ncbi:MAG: nitrophenyl compound nitroreductase subunit ArsF family protein [Bacteroidales bacterium]|nr:nitrophenyl compound nitroreductase subunit ArsF family protein [Bacteroidales bacterium]